MPGQGKWSQQEKRKRCTGPRVCSACALHPEIAPHGPYYELRRRNPITGRQESVYIGKLHLSDEQLALVNRVFDGPDSPKREEIVAAISIIVA
jgi:hypothetical protein